MFCISSILQEGIGACLIDKPEFVADCVRQTHARISRPGFSVSVKIRLHADLRRTVSLCRQLEAAGASFITVHGRTAAQRGEPVDLAAIRTIKQSLTCPILANGDVKSAGDVDRTVAETGADGVMAARGLLNNPAMFAGYSAAPDRCLAEWVRLALSIGTPFPCFHHHLIYMAERRFSRPDRRVFNALTSTAAVLSYLQDEWGVELGAGGQ